MGRTRTTVNKSSTKSPNLEKGNRKQRKFQISYDLFLTTEIHYIILSAGFYLWNHCNNSWRYNKTDFKSSQLHTNINELLNTNAVRTTVLKTIPSHQGSVALSTNWIHSVSELPNHGFKSTKRNEHSLIQLMYFYTWLPRPAGELLARTISSGNVPEEYI